MRVQNIKRLPGFFFVGDSENLEPGAKPTPGVAPSGPMSIVSHPLYVPLPPPVPRSGRPVHDIALSASTLDPAPRKLLLPYNDPLVPGLHGYVVERQSVDPLRPVPWANIMQTCGFNVIATEAFLNIAIAREGSTVPVIDVALYPIHGLLVIKSVKSETPLLGVNRPPVRDLLGKIATDSAIKLIHSRVWHFLFIRPEPESGLSRSIQHLMGPPTAAPKGMMREFSLNNAEFSSLLGTDLLKPIGEMLTTYPNQMRNYMVRSIRIGRWNATSDKEGEWVGVLVAPNKGKHVRPARRVAARTPSG